MRPFALILFLGSVLQALAWTPVGTVTSNNLADAGGTFYLSSGAIAQIDFLDSRLVRVRVNPTGKLSPRISPAIAPLGLTQPATTIGETNGAIWFTTDKMLVEVVKAPFQVITFYPDGSPMVADAEGAVLWDAPTGKIFGTKMAPANENYFGLGLNGGPINRKGRSFVMRNTDNSEYTEFTEPLYQSYPFYYGVREGKAYGVFLDNPAFPYFDMNTANQGRIIFGAEAGELDYYIIAGPDPFDVANTYGRLTGFNKLPPKWSLGYHHSHYGWKSAQEIENIAAQLRAQNFPCDTLWFDIDYMDRLHHFTFNPETFPDPIAMHQRLEAQGFHRVFISEPLLLKTDPLWPFLDSLGYFLTDPAGQSYVDSIWYGDVSFIDYTKTEVRNWYKEQLKTFLSTGISGLWLDLNEPANNFMPQATYDFDGDPRLDLEGRDLFALYHARTAYEAQRELRTNARPWNFTRSGYSGIQRYSHTWSGDPPSTFDSLKVAIQLSISMGLSGQNQFGHDTGGFLGSPSAELFTRWLEFSGFTPLFRNHSVNTAQPREPWVFGEPYTSMIRGVIRRRYEFLPYLYTLMEEASRTGRPVVAPCFFYATGDTDTYAQDSTYLFGPNLLVSPVYVEGKTNKEVYLPAGSDWIHLWSDRVYRGAQRVTVDAPVGRIPVFVRAGTLLVRGAAMEYVGAPADPSLHLDVYPAGASSFTLYEDEGNGFAYLDGGYLRTQLSSTWTDNSAQIAIERVAGDYRPPVRHWNIDIHNVTNPPGAISVSGTLLEKLDPQEVSTNSVDGWSYLVDSKVISLRIRDDATPRLIELIYPPAIVSQPEDKELTPGASLTLTTSVRGSGPFNYQWYFNGNSLTGQTNSTLQIDSLRPADFGSYSVRVRNAAGEELSHPAVITMPLYLNVSLNGKGNPTLRFAAKAGFSYALEYREALNQGVWRELLAVPVLVSDSSISFTDVPVSSVNQRYYRVSAEKAP